MLIMGTLLTSSILLMLSLLADVDKGASFDLLHTAIALMLPLLIMGPLLYTAVALMIPLLITGPLLTSSIPLLL